jgi:hypothetical protein
MTDLVMIQLNYSDHNDEINTHCSSKSADRMRIQRKNQRLTPSRHSNHCPVCDFEANKEIILANDLCQTVFLKSTQLGFPECNFSSLTYVNCISSTNSESLKETTLLVTIQQCTRHLHRAHFELQSVSLLDERRLDNLLLYWRRRVLSYPRTVYMPVASHPVGVATTK